MPYENLSRKRSSEACDYASTPEHSQRSRGILSAKKRETLFRPLNDTASDHDLSKPDHYKTAIGHEGEFQDSTASGQGGTSRLGNVDKGKQVMSDSPDMPVRTWQDVKRERDLANAEKWLEDESKITRLRLQQDFERGLIDGKNRKRYISRNNIEDTDFIQEYSAREQEIASLSTLTGKGDDPRIIAMQVASHDIYSRRGHNHQTGLENQTPLPPIITKECQKSIEKYKEARKSFRSSFNGIFKR